MEAVAIFILLGSKTMTAAIKLKDTCSLDRKAMKNLDSIIQGKNISLPTKVHQAKLWLFQ